MSSKEFKIFQRKTKSGDPTLVWGITIPNHHTQSLGICLKILDGEKHKFA